MNLLYLLGSVGGIAVLVGLNVLLFGHRAGALDMAALESRLVLDHPGFRAGAAALSADARAGLMQNEADGSLYLARIGGDKLVTRKLARGGLRALRRDGASLDLRFADVTFPRAWLAFTDAGEA
ncbi:MAG TPA: hypothetical protein VN932_13425, partial [Rhizomicrobium sp.]|nr:hypothetical protein [Rhizomicrobium sp.]